jgi:hypothetical protein
MQPKEVRREAAVAAVRRRRMEDDEAPGAASPDTARIDACSAVQ